MLVSHRHHFIYTKTLKTGGTSVESYFEPHCMAEGEWNLSHARKEYVSASGIIGQRAHGGDGTRWFNHMPAHLIREQLGEAVWDRYFKFCVVRNPFEKVLSFFFHQRRSSAGTAFEGATDIERFNHWVMTAALPQDRDVYTIDGRIAMDLVIRYEWLMDGLQEICRRLELPWQPERLPTFKAGIRPPDATVAAFYGTAARQRVAEAFAFEFDHFGYARQP